MTSRARPERTIDLARTRFIVTAYPDHRWNVQIMHWIESLMVGVEHRADYRDSLSVRNMVCARNVAIKKSALASHQSYEWFIFIDRDVRPIVGHTELCLALSADIKCCQVKQESGEAWSWPTSFHDALWCTSRRVLESINPPWFTHHKMSNDGCKMIGCMCHTFRDRALDAGFSIAHGGWAEHDRDNSWC